MLIPSIRMLDVGQCLFIAISILIKSMIKDRNVFQEMTVACLIYLIQSHMLVLLSGSMQT
ncbi:hypothetical protein EAI35_23120 [Enterobacter bugandensis]|nr:hypothetical protein EAI35_23120 [Enterobacter bugandensis]